MRGERDSTAERSGGVSVADAAIVLWVSEQTVRSWVEGGVLGQANRSGHDVVAGSSLAEALEAVRTLRELQGDDPRMRYVLDALDDRSAREQAQGSLHELEAGDHIEVGPSDLDELFQ